MDYDRFYAGKCSVAYYEWIFYYTVHAKRIWGKNHYQYCYCTSKQKNFCIEQNCGVVLLVLRRYDGYRVFDNRWFIDVVPYTSYTSDDLFYNTVIHTNWFFKLHCIVTDYLDCYKAENIILSEYAVYARFCIIAIDRCTGIRGITSSSKFCTVASNTDIYYAAAK